MHIKSLKKSPNLMKPVTQLSKKLKLQQKQRFYCAGFNSIRQIVKKAFYQPKNEISPRKLLKVAVILKKKLSITYDQRRSLRGVSQHIVLSAPEKPSGQLQELEYPAKRLEIVAAAVLSLNKLKIVKC